MGYSILKFVGIITGTYLGLFLCTLIFIVEFYLAIWPLGAKFTAQTFFASYLSVPLFIIMYLGYKVSLIQTRLRKIWFRTKFVRASEMDLMTGRRFYREEKPLSEIEEISPQEFGISKASRWLWG
jgi:amino acid permease